MGNNKILYIGNFLSKTHGTIGPAVALVNRFRESGHIVNTASENKVKFLRLIEMSGKTFFRNYGTIIIDVYSTSAIIFAEVCSFIARLRRKRVVLVLQGGGLVDGYKNNPCRIDKMFNKATIITTPSMFLKSYFQNMGYSVTYIPNTIDVDRFCFKQERPRNHSILWVRAFTKIYNPDIAVRVLAEVKKRFPDTTLNMIGPDKGNKKEIVELINTLGLSDSIKMTGKIPNENLPDFYHTHDVYLNTTSYESFGVAVLEAASCGTPVVSTSVGEIPLMWQDGENIMLAKDIDARKLAEKVCDLFSDADLYDSVQINAKHKAECYSWKCVEKQWDELLKL